MHEGFYFAEFSPDPFGGDKKRFPWQRIVHKHPAGQETVMLDFLHSDVASAIAFQMNCGTVISA